MKRSAVGIDIGGSYIKTVDSKGRRRKIKNPGNFLDLTRLIEDISRDYESVGIAVAGFVDTKGFVHESPNIPYINGKKILVQRKALYIANDATLACYGEVLFGSAKKWRKRGVVACITLGTGLGGGLVIDGKPFLGANGMSMEIGHVPLTEDKTRVCSCGRYGCAEEYVSSRAIVRYYKEQTNEEVTAEEVVDRAKKNDIRALEALKKFAFYTSKVIQIISHMFNPDAIVICGGVIHHFPGVRNSIDEFSKEIIIKPIYERLKILPAKLGEFSGAYGALGMAIEKPLGK